MSNPTTPFSWQMPTSTDLVTDLPADFEVFGQAVATSMADLLGGTTGQILSKATNTDMDFVWIANDQGDITGVTATSPLTGGGTSGAITVGIQDASTSQKGSVQLSDSTSTTSSVLAATPTAVKSSYDLANAAIPKSTVTTAGDLILATGSAAVTRLGIGTNGQVLQSNGTTASWQTPSGGGGMTLLSTTTLSSTSTTISSISQSYKRLVIYFRDVSQNTTGGYLQVRPNNTTNTSYNTFKNGNATAWTNPSPYYGDIYVTGDNTPNSGYLQVATLTIDNYANTTSSKPFYGYGTSFAGGSQGSSFTTGTVDITAAVSSLVIKFSNGGTISGTVLVYGVS